MHPWTEAHDRAVAAGEHRYIDPSTGYSVFTELGLRARGKCCGCGCRHCPWPKERDQPPPAVLRGALSTEPVTALFWSGGKDSFLALRRLWREGTRHVLLVTTYGARSRTVAHQEVGISVIRRQARALSLPLLEIPLTAEDYTEVVGRALRDVSERVPIRALAFGDLHLEHVRQWREDNLGPLAAELGARLAYPIWQVPYEDLLEDFARSGVKARVCAMPEPIAGLALGANFGADLIQALPADIDAFGENGEFHSEVLTEGLGEALRRETRP
ncbi:MAG: hypothetical protein EP330_02370 [Deltaproteobacteria bacterium]|nr:MAG: hypothetical protein EP330_02370 [Deltaproteobacteria bacterium]